MECDPMNSHKHQLGKELVCVEYPGLVRNPDRMIASLGGAADLSTAICTEKRRLELRFRPESIYSKPAFGDRHPTTGLVLRIKTRRKRDQPNEVEIKSLEIAGRVQLVYRFESMCDFQQLTALRSPLTGQVECTYDKLVPSGFEMMDPVKGPDVPYFLPPVAFSRFDTAQLNMFKSKDTVSDLLGQTDKGRARRTKHGSYQPFNLTDTLPTEPNVLAAEALKSKIVPRETIDKVRKSFQERPIWTKAALKATVQLSEDDIRYVLPNEAFYFLTGPWRGTWCRFGYDPRKYFDSRYYQMLDFRVRSKGDLHDKVKVKRTQNPIRPCMRFANPASNKRKDQTSDKPNSLNSNPGVRSDVVFTMDTLPQMRIIFYQYCDVLVPQIQEMLEKMPTPTTGACCNEKYGWLPARFDETCRDILTEIVLKNFKKQKEADPNISELESATEGEDTEMTLDELEEDEDDDDDEEGNDSVDDSMDEKKGCK